MKGFLRPQEDQLHFRYRSDINGVRAIAVSSVVLFHAGIFPFRSGFVGVDIFFVISGYLIGGIILRESKYNQFDYAVFYARRARRILPALFVVVVSVCTLGWFLLDRLEFRSVGATAFSTLLASSNFSFWHYQNYFEDDAKLAPLLMTWTLGVEEQFYLFFPLLVGLTRRVAPRRLIEVFFALILASFVLSIWWTRYFPTAAFFLLPARAWELGVGAIIAAWETNRGFSLLPDAPKWLRDSLGWSGL
jgi:peptidoglycan/LPS O-acetylase OafA/YrhL